jgi:hypothetical protein
MSSASRSVLICVLGGWLSSCAIAPPKPADTMPPSAAKGAESAAIAKPGPGALPGTAPNTAPGTGPNTGPNTGPSTGPGIAPNAPPSGTAPSPAPGTVPGAPPSAIPGGSAAATNQSGSAASNATRPSVAPPTSGARPFADVIKDAKAQPGLFTLWTKDERVWIEILPEQFDKLYYFQSNLSRGVMSEPATSMARSMLRGNVVSFKKIHNGVHFLARNFAQTANAGTPLAIATAEGTSDSLLAGLPIASAPHPERKSVLIEANALLLGDIPMITSALDSSLRAGYSLDRGNTYFRDTQASSDSVSFDVTAHFAVPRLPLPNPMPSPVPMPQARAIIGVPDARSFFLGLFYTLSKLPDEPMRPRNADGRLGHFNQQQWNFSDQGASLPQKFFVNRWRLEKKDPSAALSEPKKPITYWLDKNIPLEFRDSVKAGILEWNKAFEKIGFKDAIRVEQQPDNALWSTHETGRASVRWFVDYSEGAMAVGPSRTDPRSGEILDADVTISNAWATLPRRLALAQLPRPLPETVQTNSSTLENRSLWTDQQRSFLPSLLDRGADLTQTQRAQNHSNETQGAHGHGTTGFETCAYDHAALQEASFALDLIAMRQGSLMDVKEAERLVQAVLKDVVSHEVGHTLGLRHNFRASTVYTQSQISNPSFSRSNGISGSVMDYNAFNIALDKETQGDYVNSTIGPYDYWAIEYAYRELPVEIESMTLSKIAARNSEPLLAYGTDEELFGDLDGMDPEVNQRDVGGDPLGFAQRRIQLSRELINRLQTRILASGESYDVLTRNFVSGISQLSQAFSIASKYVGGVVYVRDQAGGGRAPFTPVPTNQQRAALKLITEQLFESQGFDLKPEFVSRLTEDTLRRGAQPPVDRSLDTTLLNMQTQALDRLMSPRVAERLQNSQAKLSTTKEAFTLSELYTSITRSIWGEGPSFGDVATSRRALQREHLRRLATAILRPGLGSAQGDARALHRLTAKSLLAKAQSAKANPRLSLETRAHLDEVADTLEAALKAQTSRIVG